MPWAKTGNLKGQRGVTWFTGTGAPGTVSGALAGDLYLDVSTGDIYTFS